MSTKQTAWLRIILLIAVILLQVGLIVALIYYMRTNAVYMYTLIELAGLIVIFLLMNRNEEQMYKMSWVTIILVLPVFGLILYILWGRSGMGVKQSRVIMNSIKNGSQYITHDEHVYKKLEARRPEYVSNAHYLKNEGHALYQNTTSVFYKTGEHFFKQLLIDLEKAEKFIFLEYFIVSEGEIWNSIFEVLRRKAAQGIEVRFMYDDLGSVWEVPDKLAHVLEDEGIKVAVFNPINRYLSRLYANYRNHQKITVIDGKVGFTGGINLANEYANINPPHGHFKDSANRLEGDAVNGLTFIFLQMWESEHGLTGDYEQYIVKHMQVGDGGFYQPFADGPVNNPHNPAKTMYGKLISQAANYVYITTPYLILDNVTKEMLCTAAQSGVDVKIITPHIGDSPIVHAITHSNYSDLLVAGVHIYEYTPGFMHQKTICCDGKQAIFGSINTDYRSFYLNFENGVWVCNSPVIEDIESDFTATLNLSEEIKLGKWNRRSVFAKTAQSLCAVLTPLL